MKDLKNYECDGQITLSDYRIIVTNNGYDIFHEHCNHRGWNKPATETEPSMWMCGFKNGRPAKGWDDWIPCKECNCYLIKEHENERV